MGLSFYDVYQFVIEYKWWIAAIVPVVLAILVLRGRG